jgi:thioredoxin 1
MNPVPPLLHVACLCAAWCRACEAYRPLFETVTAALTPAVAAHWVDIEDEASLVGDLDVETFPTLLVFDQRGLHFAGPVPPDAANLQRLVRSARTQVPQHLDALAWGLAQRLMQLRP